MKKAALMTFVLMAPLYSMQEENKHDFKINSTTITVTKENIADLNVDLIVLGENEQFQLQKHYSSQDKKVIGAISLLNIPIIYQKDKGDDSPSDDDTYKVYDIIGDTISKTMEKTVRSRVIRVEEPYIALMPQLEGGYKKLYTRKMDTEVSCYYDQDAIRRTSEDIILCVKNVLKYAAENKIKNIALSPLGAAVGVPRENVAHSIIEALYWYVKENPSIFDIIFICIKKRFELDLYKNCSDKYISH